MADAPHLTDGSLLQGGKYRIVRFIGAGGFGCTYEAHFELLNLRVAIKEFFPATLCNRDATGRISVGTEGNVEFVGKMRRKFIDEARTLCKYKNIDGIVKVSDLFEENGTAYFVMDYIDGRSIQKIIDKQGPMPEAEALRLISEAGRALQAVHALGSLHLDIKPDNIMVGADGHPILIDFGVSKQYSQEDGCNTSTLLGYSPGYAPLEQMKGNVQAFTPATDVYALGATLYAMLTGNTPPDATDLLNDADTLKFPPRVSQATRRAIEAAMEPKVKNRPATIADFLALLPSASKPASKSASKPASNPRPHEYSTRIQQVEKPHTNGKKYIWVAVAAAIIAIAAVIAWRMSSGSAPTPIIENDNIDEVAIEASVDSAASAPVDAAVAEAAPAAPEPSKLETAVAAEPAKPEPTKPEPTKPEPAKPEAAVEAEPAKPEPEPQKVTEPAKPVEAPASSTQSSTVMIAAYTDGGSYRAYTVADWDGFSSAQKAKVVPIGVQLSASGQKFIIAPTDAAGGKKVKWEDANSDDDFVDIPGLRNVKWPEDGAQAKRDFNGRSNTNTILAYGREHGITYSAASAAVNYSVKGHGGWCLPASGQLWLMYENKSAINNVLSWIGGNVIADEWYWSSTEEKYSTAWFVLMPDGSIYNGNKANSNRVRAVAPVPSSAI